MKGIEIRSASEDNLDDLCSICIPPEQRNDPIMVEGIKEKRKWAEQALRTGLPMAKLAYIDGKAVGLIHYDPLVDEDVIRIHCILFPPVV